MEENQSAHSIYDVQSQCVSFPVWVKQRCSDWTEHMSVKVRGHASRWPRKPWGRRVYGVFKRNICWNKVSTFCARIITLETFACFCGGSGRIWVFKKTFPSFFFFFWVSWWRMDEMRPSGGAAGHLGLASLFPPGLQAIYAECRRLYPDQPNPLQVTAIVKYW